MLSSIGKFIGGPISDFFENITDVINSIKDFFINVFDLFYTFFTFFPQPFRSIFLTYFFLIVGIMVVKIVSDKI